MSILSPSFPDVAAIAGMEVFLRGIGDKKQYDYTIFDCITVAALYDELGEKMCEDYIRHISKRKQTRSLWQVYNRVIQARREK